MLSRLQVDMHTPRLGVQGLLTQVDMHTPKLAELLQDLSQRAAIVRVEDCEHPAADCPWGAEHTIRRPAARKWILAYSGTRRPLAEGHIV